MAGAPHEIWHSSPEDDENHLEIAWPYTPKA